MKIKNIIYVSLLALMLADCDRKSMENDFIRGFDASAVNDEWNKDKYFDFDRQKKDVFEILKNNGVNWIRLRIWNDPDNPNNPEKPGASNLTTVLNQAVRAKSFGLKFLLDFHYSDYWADPGKQAIPQSWLDCKTSDEVSRKLYDWTEKVLKALNDANASPDMIQIGNEINTGILTGYYENGKLKPLSSVIGGSSTRSKENYIKYLAAGIKAARKVCPQSKIMLHVAEGGGKIEWLLDMYKEANLDYDVIGLSYYPFEKTHGSIESLGENIKFFRKKYGKEIVIAETAHPWYAKSALDADLKNATANLTLKNGKIYPGITENKGIVSASVQNQAAVISAVAKTAKDAGAKGFFTWGGEYLGSWRYGMFSDKGKAFESLKLFQADF
ncbi:glycosyl hydrolase 53 family protein [Treponema sp. C6A8]|uniref:glycosyl hydrolase 53 family protein n=1 Tax=Treponema sp. C6A8 TaxID=1410609 RepID=UPI0006851D55|nr:glycosyl hydrolase 53 family protein [Treponema sp. C6A8]